jgi:hypothetical protein
MHDATALHPLTKAGVADTGEDFSGELLAIVD